MRAHVRILLLAVIMPWLAVAAPPAQKLSFDFHRADLHNVLRILAEAGRMNLVVSDDLSGTVTLRLRNVSWEDAFEAVLSVNGLGVERKGNILRVARLSDLAQEAETRARLKTAKENAGPLVTHLIPVSYALAKDLLPHVQALLSPRGTASVDARTNVIIVRDVEGFDSSSVTGR